MLERFGRRRGPAWIREGLRSRVQGQEVATTALANAVYAHVRGLLQGGENPRPYGSQHLLLIGGTGTGKSHLIRSLEEVTGLPIHIISATSLVQTGYVGMTVDAMIRHVFHLSQQNVSRTERSIIFIDEIDKVRGAGDCQGPDVSGLGVQHALLTVLDGRLVPMKSGEQGFPDSGLVIDTKKILFICAGAFVGLERIVAKRIHVPDMIGFTPAPSRNAPRVKRLLRQATLDDIVEFGLIPELVGRFTSLAVTESLDARDLLAILDKPEGALTHWKAFMKDHGIELVVDEGAQMALARRAITFKTGARALDRLVKEQLDPLIAEIGTLMSEGAFRVTLTEESVTGAAEPRIEKRSRPRTQSASSAAEFGGNPLPEAEEEAEWDWEAQNDLPF